MRIPWSWLRENLSISEDTSLETFLEKVNYLGLECEKVFSKQEEEVLINFLPFSNRKDLNSWIGIVNEISLSSSFYTKPLTKENEQFSLESVKVSNNNFSLVTVENLVGNNQIKKIQTLNNYLSSVSLKESKEQDIFSCLINLVNLKTAYKIEIFCLDSFYKNGSYCSIKNPNDKALLKVNDNIFEKLVSTLSEKELTAFLFNEIKLLFENPRIKLYSLSKNFFLKKKEKKTSLTHSYIEEKLGIRVLKTDILNAFRKLNFKFFEKKNSYLVTSPFYRKDLINKEDLLEEIGKIFDYNKIPAINLPAINNFEDNFSKKKRNLKEKIIFYLANLGFHEVTTYSLVSEQSLIEKKESYFELVNPKSLKHKFYRKFIFPSHVELFKNILGNGFENFSIFEISKFYLKSKDESPVEKEKISISIVKTSNDFIEDKNEEIFHLKKIVKNLFLVTGGFKDNFKWEKSGEISFLEGGFCLSLNNEKIGFLGFLKKTIFQKKNFKNKNILVCEITLDKFLETLIHQNKNNIIYKNFSRSPIVKKDISFFISKNFSIDSISSFIEKQLSNNFLFVFNVELIDIYQKSLAVNEHSLCFRLEFSGQKENLKNQQINDKIEELFISLENNFEVVRR